MIFRAIGGDVGGKWWRRRGFFYRRFAGVFVGEYGDTLRLAVIVQSEIGGSEVGDVVAVLVVNDDID